MTPASVLFLSTLFALSATAVHHQQQQATLAFPSDGVFTIMQFTDFHCAHPEENNKTVAVVNSVLDAWPETNLVALTGDVLSGMLLPSLDDFINTWSLSVSPMELRNIPWATTLGNHDPEVNHAPYPNRNVVKIDQQHPLSMTQAGPVWPGHESAANYHIELVDGVAAGAVVASLFFLDADRSWEIPDEEVEWFLREVESLNANRGDQQPLPIFMFYHIAIRQFVDVFNLAPIHGNRSEATCCSDHESGLYDAALKSNVKAMFVGHDHTNNFCGSIPGDDMVLCYGQKTGFAFDNPVWGHGGRVIQLSLNKTAAEETLSWNTFVVNEEGKPMETPIHQPPTTAARQAKCDRFIGHL